MSTRTGTAAIAWARGQIKNPVRDYLRLCLQFTRLCYGVAAKYPDANGGWAGAKKRHATTKTANIPAGVPVWWAIGKWGHVAISTGNGMCVSNDILRRGKVDEVKIDTITSRWGAKLLGWSEDINGVTVYTPPAGTPFPVGIGPGKSTPSARSLQRQLKRAGLMPAGVPEADNYGPQTRAAVVRFHARHPQFRTKAGVADDGRIGPKGWAFLFGTY